MFAPFRCLIHAPFWEAGSKDPTIFLHSGIPISNIFLSANFNSEPFQVSRSHVINRGKSWKVKFEQCRFFRKAVCQFSVFSCAAEFIHLSRAMLRNSLLSCRKSANAINFLANCSGTVKRWKYHYQRGSIFTPLCYSLTAPFRRNLRELKFSSQNRNSFKGWATRITLCGLNTDASNHVNNSKSTKMKYTPLIVRNYIRLATFSGNTMDLPGISCSSVFC